MTKPLVSVVIPCYNAQRWLAETIESVLRQTWSNMELIVVNDGSTDASRDMLDSFRSPVLRIVDQPNRGQSAALNRGLREARGDFIQFLDADDVLAPDKIELQLRRLVDNPGCIATAEWARFQDDPGSAVFSRYENWKDMDPVEWLTANWKDGGGMMFPAMWLLPASITSSIGPWREDLSLVNDTEYFTRAVIASRRVLFCEGARACYRSGIVGSVSGIKSRAGWESYFAVVDLCEGYLLAREDSDRTRRACAMLWQRLAQASYPYHPAIANRALARAKTRHAARLDFEAGPAFLLVSRLAGWKIARVLQRLSGRE